MDSTSNLILGIGLMIIMWGMGLSLVFDDFRRIIKYPKAVIIGLTNQLILLPIIGFALVHVFPVSTDIAVGIMILAACPGGPTSNLITHLAKGDTALSVTLTALSSFITVLTVPFIVNFSLIALVHEGQVVQLDVWDTIMKIMTVVIIPVVLGMVFKRIFPGFANRMSKPVKIASGIILAVIILGVVIKEREHLADWFIEAGLIALSLNLLTMLVGFYSARMFSLSDKQGTSISIESGIQNGTMALAIAGGLLNNSHYQIAPAIYSLIMFFTGGYVIYFGFRKLDGGEVDVEKDIATQTATTDLLNRENGENPARKDDE